MDSASLIDFEENKFCPAINQRFVPEQNLQAKNAINVRFPSIGMNRIA